MRVTYSPQVQRIRREQRQRSLLALAKRFGWLILYWLILLAWVALP